MRERKRGRERKTNNDEGHFKIKDIKSVLNCDNAAVAKLEWEKLGNTHMHTHTLARAHTRFKI